MPRCNSKAMIMHLKEIAYQGVPRSSGDTLEFRTEFRGHNTP